MIHEDIFFDLWCKSFVEGGTPVWVDPSPPKLKEHCQLADMGLLVSGTVNDQDDYVWRLTPLGCLVGAALNCGAIPDGV